jgi:integrase
VERNEGSCTVNARTRIQNLIGPGEAFDSWAEPLVQSWHDSGRKEGFSPDTAGHYRHVWLAWCCWLDGKRAKHLEQAKFRWQAATPLDVTKFLTGPAPKRKTRATKANELASFSRRSYWRVLRDVYATAASSGLRPDNPVVLVSEPSVASADRKPQCIDPALLATLQDPQAVQRLVPDASPGWLSARDRAAIALVAHCAPTAGELHRLTGQDLRLPDRRQRPLPGSPASPDGELDLPGRKVIVPNIIHSLLIEWLEERQAVLQAMRERATAHAPSQRIDLAKEALGPPHKQPLFLARESPDGSPCRVPPPTIHLMFSRAIARAQKDLLASGQLKEGEYHAKGPASVRNSVIRMWALEHGAGAAAAWAGLKSIKGRHA